MLQDELQENDREMMTVQGTGSLVTNVYLTGKIYASAPAPVLTARTKRSKTSAPALS